MSDLNTAMAIAASGMRVQGVRLRVVAENIANAESTSAGPGGDPYRRKLVTFADALDKATGGRVVEVRKVTTDPSAFPVRYQPNHPSANAEGYVKMPNVNTLVETVDMREAQRSYEANLGVIDMARAMTNRTLELLRA